MKELWLFTTRFPHGFREAFLENELPVLAERFSRVVIFPEHAEGALRALPPNVEVRHPVKDPFAGMRVPGLLGQAGIVWRLIRSLVRDAPSMGVLRQQWPQLRARIGQLMQRAETIRKEVMPAYDPDKVVVYAYWTHDWATVLGIVREHMPHLVFFSRAHGFDIYEEQNTNGWIPFRSFQLQHVQRVHCASRTGMQHLQRKHASQAGRFVLARLGTTDHGPGPHDPTGPLKVVSCSFLIPRKRVLLLVEALSLVKVPVRWVHFGSGVEEEAVRAAVARLPAHVEVELKGMKQNADIMEWYRSRPVDVFVHLARLEGGVAVAAQEAASFGIPVVAADSGGLRELMDGRTGILLPQDPSATEVAALLDGFRDSPLSSAAYRTGVRSAWAEGFEASTVFHQFVDAILGSDRQPVRGRSKAGGCAAGT